MESATTETGYVRPGVGDGYALAAPPNRQLPDGGAKRAAGIRDIFQTYAGLAGQAVELAKLSAVRTYRRARYGAVDNYSRGTRKAQQMASRTWNRAGDLQRQHPLRVLAMVAGAAFLAGVASRVWRSRSL